MGYCIEPVFGGITQDVYDKYLQQFKARQQNINLLLEEHTYADESYVIAATTVLNLAKRALSLFESSEVLEKRALLNFLLQNSTVDGKKPSYALRSPFDAILTFAKRPTGLRSLGAFGTVDWKALEREMQWLMVAMPGLKML